MWLNHSILTSLIVSLLLITGTLAQTYSITGVQATGSGCPRGAVNTNTGGTELSLRFDSNFVAVVGPGQPPPGGTKNCQVSFTVNVPKGWKFAFSRFAYASTYTLSPLTQAAVSTTYSFWGDFRTSTSTSSVPAPGTGSVVSLYTFSTPSAGPAPPSVLYSPCGQSTIVSINSIASVVSTGFYGSGSVQLNNFILPESSIIWARC